MFEIVEFPSEGATLRGRLYLQSSRSEPTPIVIMTHGFSATVNGMVADRYAEVFYEAGFAVLLYDHRNLGMSEGEPRQQINRWIQARGYRDAIDYVSSLTAIDASRIAIWGDSMSGGAVIVVGAVDSRVRAIIAQVPACGDKPPPADPDGRLFALISETLTSGDVSGSEEMTIGPMPVVSYDQRGTPSCLEPLTAFHWFIEYGGRYGTEWENWATFVVPETPAPFHPALCAPYVEAPLLMMVAHEDEMHGASSHVARLTYDLAPQPKEWVALDGGHFGLLYYPGELFNLASTTQKDFLLRNL